MLLKNLRWLADGVETGGDLRLGRGRIVETGRGLAPRRRERVVELEGWRALPGLVNAHDHLPLNLLPHLGAPPYDSIYRFAEEVYRPDRSPIREVLAAPAHDRLRWGGYRNLISGVTTVVHHDPFPRRVLLDRAFPVRVFRRYGWSHSLGFGPDPAAAYARCRGRPFVIHAAEGTDEECRREVDRLGELGVLGRNTVLVHGVAVSAAQRARLEAAGSSLVWCPASNLRLYGETAPIADLIGRIRLALGTDSTLTGSPTLLDEARVAAATGLASAEEVLDMVTAGAAAIFGLAGGRIAAGRPADLALVPARGAGAAGDLLAARPADLGLVAVGGRPRLARPRVAEALGLGTPNAVLEGEPRWLCGDPAGVKRRLEAAAGRGALEANPLWSMLR